MLETETVLDRRRLRRSVSIWRAAGLAGLLIAIGVLAFGGDKLASLTGEKQIARVTIEGTITEDRDQLKMLKDIADDNSVSGVLLFINSPGGTTTGGEALFEGIRTLAKKKPVVAQFGTVAASAAYIAGLASDHIVARGNTITGSVGVIVQWPEVVQLLDKIGVKMNEVKSGPLKASPSPFEPLDDASKKVAEGMVADGFKWFIGLVETRRGVKAADIPGLLEGRIYSGREALDAKLIDQLGGEDEAVKWLKDVKSVPQTAKVTDWKPGNSGGYGFAGMSAGIAGWLLGPAAGDAVNFLLRDRMISTLGLDGLLSVWHPSEK
ncbi:signal peptide peptidase SppA [Hyphomicrobium facile]|uniref:Signal peptide peptidase A. Serine peptidase. MEROPS family S49 n=1 Tax=Hyphomicrobium facile TaxID=51670 RepID=A0A1I7MUZ2_9HYPH|nr:signal peptide peptidase SppA [Hyphomicrobium facile]SFV26232.1 signal peptide peptidase A. Serine peptidase. MEROPS family S49 [Hyphomicrobium facile]